MSLETQELFLQKHMLHRGHIAEQITVKTWFLRLTSLLIFPPTLHWLLLIPQIGFVWDHLFQPIGIKRLGVAQKKAEL